MRRVTAISLLSLTFVVMPLVASDATAAPKIDWIRTPGFHVTDSTVDAAEDFLVTGVTYYSDDNNRAYVHKYDTTGAMISGFEFGVNEQYERVSISNASSGNVITSGLTSKTDPARDVFVENFDPNGAQSWSDTFGTPTGDDLVGALPDGIGNVYAAGNAVRLASPELPASNDVFLRKYNSAGQVAFTKQISSVGADFAYDAAVDEAGGIYVVGSTFGELGGPTNGASDAFLVKFDFEGNKSWAHQYGTSGPDRAAAVTVDHTGNVLLAGMTNVDLLSQYGAQDAFLQKYNSGGELQWTQQIATVDSDEVADIDTDHLGNIFVIGSHDHTNLGRDSSAGRSFISKYDPSGNLLWHFLLQPETTGVMTTLSVDSGGSVFIAGVTQIEVAGQITRENWMALLRESPEGDFNFDSRVDGGDFLAWQRTFGSTTELSADADNSGVVDSADLSLWAARFGSNSTISQVPEPSSLALCAVMLLFVRKKLRTT